MSTRTAQEILLAARDSGDPEVLEVAREHAAVLLDPEARSQFFSRFSQQHLANLLTLKGALMERERFIDVVEQKQTVETPEIWIPGRKEPDPMQIPLELQQAA